MKYDLSMLYPRSRNPFFRNSAAARIRIPDDCPCSVFFNSIFLTFVFSKLPSSHTLNIYRQQFRLSRSICACCIFTLQNDWTNQDPLRLFLQATQPGMVAKDTIMSQTPDKLKNYIQIYAKSAQKNQGNLFIEQNKYSYIYLNHIMKNRDYEIKKRHLNNSSSAT